MMASGLLGGVVGSSSRLMSPWHNITGQQCISFSFSLPGEPAGSQVAKLM